MKQARSDRHTVAWVKLAECISRGEEERAVGVYRLLSHSCEDQAVARQLEGDIHLSFNNEKDAIAQYDKAADLYQKSKRLLEAAAVYEHILALQGDNVRFRKNIVELYQQLGIHSKINEHSRLLEGMK